MASIIAGAGIVGESGSEGHREGEVFVEERISAISIAEGEGGRSDMFGYPMRITGLAIERGEVYTHRIVSHTSRTGRAFEMQGDCLLYSLITPQYE